MTASRPELDLAAVIDQAPVAFLVTAADGTVLNTNDTLLRWLGRTREAVVGRARFADLLSPSRRLIWLTHQLPTLERLGQVSGVALELDGPEGGLPVLVSATMAVTSDGDSFIRLTVVEAAERRAYERGLLAARASAEEAERRLRALQGFAEICATATTTTGLLDDLAVAVAEGLEAAGASLWVADDGLQGVLRLVATCDVDGSVLPEVLDDAVLGSSAALLAAGEVAMAHDPVEVFQLFPGLSPAADAAGYRSLIAFPFIHDGECLGIGVVHFHHRSHRPVDPDGLAGAGRLIGESLTRMRLQDRLRSLATYDGLTGLPNRLLFTEHLDHALARAARASAPVALLFVDLDEFKPINDTWGHAAGDEVLVTVARRLRSAVREVDFVARLAGDEFVVVCEGADETTGDQVRRRIHDALAAPAEVEGQALRLSASVGVAIHQPGPGTGNRDRLLAEADGAMYVAKRARRDPAVTTGH